MTDESKPKPKIENLELNRESIQDLSVEQAENVEGGLRAAASNERWCSLYCSETCVLCR